MKKQTSFLVLALFASAAQALPIGIYEFSGFIHATELGGSSLQDTRFGSGPGEFGPAGLSSSFSSGLNANNFGTITWSLTNNTGGALSNARFFGFLDAEIDESINTFFNEYGDSSDLLLGSGASDGLADSWEIDEPGFSFGNIYTNLLAGSLDNTNSVPSSSVDDVSLALGFDLGTIGAGDTLTFMFDISDINNGGLRHGDSKSPDTVWFNGFLLAVPEPETFFLVAIGLLGIALQHRKAKRTVI